MIFRITPDKIPGVRRKFLSSHGTNIAKSPGHEGLRVSFMEFMPVPCPLATYYAEAIIGSRYSYHYFKRDPLLAEHPMKDK